MIEHLAKGFKVTGEVSLISNVKAAILEHLKDPEAKEMMGAYMMAGPLFMLALSGNINFKFEDFDDLRENPMAAPVMVCFKDLFESMIGSTPRECTEAVNNKDPSAEGF